MSSKVSRRPSRNRLRLLSEDWYLMARERCPSSRFWPISVSANTAIRLFLFQEPFDNILCLIRLAAMVEREDDESQACSITPQRLLHIMEIGTAFRRGILWNHHRLTIGIPFLRIEFIRRADLTHHTLMNHLNEQCTLFPRNRRGTEFESY